MHTTNLNLADFNQESKQDQRQRSKLSCYRTINQSAVLQGIIENLIDGILIVSTQSELIYVNDIASRILRQLHQNSSPENFLPKEIWHICQSLIQSRNLFPHQIWQLSSEIFVDISSVFKVNARWIYSKEIKNDCILITVKDYYQTIKNIAVEESQKYGLTPR
ncbi:MAG: helix-turn-helix transcriptional regulator [Symploca sp. SIO2E9]|nr:helix-turn-helix transcriptional regulator [Symploca sp. SIO2E9]